MKLFVAYKVYRSDKPSELLGIFDNEILIKKSYKTTNTKNWIIGYGKINLNQALPLKTEKWSKSEWIWLQ